MASSTVSILERHCRSTLQQFQQCDQAIAVPTTTRSLESDMGRIKNCIDINKQIRPVLILALLAVEEAGAELPNIVARFKRRLESDDVFYKLGCKLEEGGGHRHQIENLMYDDYVASLKTAYQKQPQTFYNLCMAQALHSLGVLPRDCIKWKKDDLIKAFRCLLKKPPAKSMVKNAIAAALEPHLPEPHRSQLASARTLMGPLQLTGKGKRSGKATGASSSSRLVTAN
jgi:hypothetical protein